MDRGDNRDSEWARVWELITGRTSSASSVQLIQNTGKTPQVSVGIESVIGILHVTYLMYDNWNYKKEGRKKWPSWNDTVGLVCRAGQVMKPSPNKLNHLVLWWKSCSWLVTWKSDLSDNSRIVSIDLLYLVCSGCNILWNVDTGIDFMTHIRSDRWNKKSSELLADAKMESYHRHYQM